MTIRQNTQQGGALLSFALVFAVVAAIGLLTLAFVLTTGYRHAQMRVAAWQARLHAESGLEEGFAFLAGPGGTRLATEDASALFSLTQRTEHTVTIEPVMAPDRWRVRSEGRAHGTIRSCSQEAYLLSPLLFTILAADEIVLSRDAVVEGPLCAGGMVRLDESATVTGPIQARTLISGGRSRTAEMTHEGITRPWRFVDAFDSLIAGLRFSVVRSSATPLRMAYQDTTIAVAGSAEADGILIRNGTLIVQGTLRVTGNLEITAPADRPALIVEGDIRIEPGAMVRIDGLIFTPGTFHSSGSTNIRGSLIARRVEGGGGFHLRRDKSLAARNLPGFPSGVVAGVFLADL